MEYYYNIFRIITLEDIRGKGVVSITWNELKKAKWIIWF